MPMQTRGANFRTELRELISRLGGEPDFIEQEDFEAGHSYLVRVIEAVWNEAHKDGQLEESRYGF